MGKNEVRVEGDVVHIMLGGKLGGFAVIDKEDYDLVKDKSWFNSEGRPCCSVKKRIYSLGQILLELTDGTVARVKSVNGDKLDCRRSNLEVRPIKGNVITNNDDSTSSIHLGGGNGKKVAVIDSSDVPAIAGVRWSYRNSKGSEYAFGTVNGKTVSIHRYLLQYHGDDHIDHINHDGLDNRRSNLRVVSAAVNLRNCRPYGESGLRGVGRLSGKWQARVMIDGKKIHIGQFKTKEEAAAAYDKYMLAIDPDIMTNKKMGLI